MTAPSYLGAALCYNKAHVGLYKSTCLAVNELGNAWEIHSSEFDYTGILMHNFYLALVDGGGTNQCVCKFKNTGSEWAYAGHWGPCNGACVGKYTCNGNTPVIVNDKRDADVEKRASPTSLAVPLAVNWKTLLCIAEVLLGNGLV